MYYPSDVAYEEKSVEQVLNSLSHMNTSVCACVCVHL